MCTISMSWFHVSCHRRYTVKKGNNTDFIYKHDDMLLVKLHTYDNFGDWIIALNRSIFLISVP